MARIQSTRRDVLAYSAIGTLGSLAGCLEAAANADLGRGDRLNAEEMSSIEIPAGKIYSLTLYGSQFLELEYSAEISKPDEGFEEPGPVDIRVMSEDAYRERNALADPSSGDIERLRRLDVDGEVENAAQLEAGIYHVLIDNSASERSIEADLSVDVYEYTRDEDEVSCEGDSDDVEINQLSVYDDSGLITRDITLRYHVAINDTSGDEYSLTLDLMTAADEITISETQQPGLCSTHFVEVDRLDELAVNDGFFERNEKLKAALTIEKDGEPFEEREVSFTAQSGY